MYDMFSVDVSQEKPIKFRNKDEYGDNRLFVEIMNVETLRMVANAERVSAELYTRYLHLDSLN